MLSIYFCCHCYLPCCQSNKRNKGNATHQRLLLLTIVYLVVTFLGMGASSYIMRMIFNNILIILVILFGPEIRKILEQVGKGKATNFVKELFNSGVAIDVAEMKQTIDATCKSCAEMADAKSALLSCSKTKRFWATSLLRVRLLMPFRQRKLSAISSIRSHRFTMAQWLSEAIVFMRQVVFCLLQE